MRRGQRIGTSGEQTDQMRAEAWLADEQPPRLLDPAADEPAVILPRGVGRRAYRETDSRPLAPRGLRPQSDDARGEPPARRRAADGERSRRLVNSVAVLGVIIVDGHSPVPNFCALGYASTYGCDLTCTPLSVPIGTVRSSSDFRSALRTCICQVSRTAARP